MNKLLTIESNILDVKLIDEVNLARLNGGYELAPECIMTVTNVIN